MRTAVLRGLRPTTLTHRRRKPYGKWCDLDFLLLEAFQSIEDETRDGLPVWISRSPEVQFEVEEAINFAQAALDAHDKRLKGPKGDKEPPAGLQRYVVARAADGSPAPEGGLERERLLIELATQQASSAPVLEGSEVVVDRRRPASGYDASEYG